MDYDPYDALLHHVYQQTQGEAWFRPTEENIATGVCIRVAAGNYRVFPYNLMALAPFEAAVRLLNPVVAVKIRSAAVHAAFSTITDADASIYIDSDTKIQVFDSMHLLPRAEKEQCAAFIRDERVIVIWADNFDSIIPLCREIEDKLIKLVWRLRNEISHVPSIAPSSNAVSIGASDANLAERNTVFTEAIPVTDKERNNVHSKSRRKTSRWGWSWRVSPEKRGAHAEEYDLEKECSSGSSRPIRLYAPFYCGLATALSILELASLWLNGFSITIIIVSSCSLHHPSSFAYHCSSVCSLWATYPWCLVRFLSTMRIQNITPQSPPKPNKEVDAALPHITIELPVFKESLEHTIAPSVFSIKKAMQTYARQGGTSAIFVHDDGLQLISPKEREERIAFYSDHNIGWVARPKHDNTPGGFKRAGRFKKASNMNYGLALSLKLEKHLKVLEDAEQRGELDVSAGYECLEDTALALAIEEMYNETGGKWQPWASNGKSLRVGEIILIVDADTIVPEDCFRDAARELAESPDVGIIQHESDVMQVAHHYFENGIAHFTRRINKCISIGCANGEMAPFVGHNAFLRWSALQDAAFIDPEDGKKKIWSESNVSEDFDMALRLQLKHYSIRWASYSNGGFKEGVSLTVDDELNRWQKYSYGCNELIFNPLIHWWKMGPIAKQLRIFVWSGAPVHYKLSMMAYMFSYYGIAAAAVLSLVNYLLLGFQIEVDGFFLHSFEVWLACTVVFPGVGNLGFTLLEYRLGHRNLLASAIENVTWIPFFFFFFGGLSIHLSQALLSHLFSYNITWGATKKEVERSNFFIEVPRIIKRFHVALILCSITVVGMIILGTSLVPAGWQVDSTDWAVILPLAIVVGSHILFPIVLNPWLMIFSY
ncbi:glycosyl transferase family group 2-domain-containing protein [Suillus bovinus]|uniref:glycosyl transferase family group 2-domain-containing protein n=1 Tax=Suillus bovinus TaxID=48563 RepID=UPI001B862F55|nr:glycosyl transferase family group 2-domain-containing protein [Suillus bovinus]KAG2155256.1 glycosyl transferase family group 2-domain-containing protein [Suillus bovinus]